MMKRGLGRGLGALIVPTPTPTPSQEKPSGEFSSNSDVAIRDIPIGRIDPNPDQPRTHFDAAQQEELARSITLYGLLEPIIVTPTQDRYVIIAGERRFRAYQALVKSTIPALVRSATELEMLELALVENIQREDLNPMEQARAVAKLLHEFGLTQEEAAKRLGKARSTVANLLRLCDLPQEIQEGLEHGLLSVGHAKVLLSLKTTEEQLAMYRQLIAQPSLSVKALHEHAAHRRPALRLVNHELHDVEENLQATLGTKVRVHRKGTKGAIIIETYSDEEFQSVIRKILRP